MMTAAFPTLFGDCLVVTRHLVQLRVYALSSYNSESQPLSEQLTGFIASLAGSNPREGDFFKKSNIITVDSDFTFFFYFTLPHYDIASYL